MKSRFSSLLAMGVLGAAMCLPNWSTRVCAASPDASLVLPPLSSPATGAWTPGKHVWVDLFTSEPETARVFYTGLFGWTSEVVGGGASSYTLLKNGGHALAGIVNPAAFQRGNENATPRHAHWVEYFSVADLPEALDNVKAAGGTVLVGQRQVKGRGVQAIVKDPCGAILGLIKSDSGDPQGPRTVNTGDWAWAELFVQAPVDVHGFYREVFQYEVRELTQPGGAPAFLFYQGNAPRGGLAQINITKAGAKPAWLAFVRVDDVSATAQKAVELGGRVLMKPRPGPESSVVAIVADPLGGTIGLLQGAAKKNSSK